LEERNKGFNHKLIFNDRSYELIGPTHKINTVSNMYHHFLITRFNLPYYKWTHDKYGKKVCDENWLKRRFEIFDRYCFPSVKGQSNQNFLWLVFFDVNTPFEFKERIYDYAKSYHNFSPVFLRSVDELSDYLHFKIDSSLKKESDLLITSRLDNDDVLHENYTEIVQSFGRDKKNCIINFEKGFIFDINKNTLYSSVHKSSPFLTRIECLRDGYSTVMSFNHLEASMMAPVKQVRDIPGWMIIVHEGNLSNRVSGRPLFFPHKIFQHYNVKSIGCKYRMDYPALIKHGLKKLKKIFCP